MLLSCLEACCTYPHIKACSTALACAGHTATAAGFAAQALLAPGAFDYYLSQTQTQLSGTSIIKS